MLKLIQLEFKGNVNLTKRYQYISYNLIHYFKNKSKIHNRVSVCFNDSQEKKVVFHDTVKKFCEVECYLPFNEIDTINDDSKIVLIICQILFSLLEKNQIATTFRDDVMNDIINNNWINEIVFLKKSYNSEKTLCCWITTAYQKEYTEFVLNCRVNKGEVIKISFFKARLNIYYSEWFNKSYWEGNNYVITDSSNQIRTVFDLYNKTFTVEFLPKNNTVEQLENYYYGLYYKKSVDEFLEANAKFINW